MSTLVEALAVAPIARGLAAVLIAGAALPLAGVLVLRLELVTLRFTLMHGALLGAAVALAIGLDPLLPGLAVALLLVVTHVPLARAAGLRLGYVAAFLMVITIGAAAAVIYRAAVPAPDVFAVLWGDPFALTRTDLIAVAAFGAALIAFVALAHRRIAALLFDQEVAAASGVAVRRVRAAVLLAVGCAVAFAMKLIGALLLDAILLLPAILAMALARSVRGLFLLAAAAGLAVAAAGFRGGAPGRPAGQRRGDAGGSPAAAGGDRRPPKETRVSAHARPPARGLRYLLLAVWIGCTTAAGADGGTVVASTEWTAAFAHAAGITEVTVLAPAASRHPAEYQLRPSDLRAVAARGRAGLRRLRGDGRTPAGTCPAGRDRPAHRHRLLAGHAPAVA